MARLRRPADLAAWRYSVDAGVRHAFAHDQVPEKAPSTGAYALVDLSAGATLIRSGRVHSIALRMDNLFDVLSREATSRIKDFAPSPGRNLAILRQSRTHANERFGRWTSAQPPLSQTHPWWANSWWAPILGAVGTL